MTTEKVDQIVLATVGGDRAGELTQRLVDDGFQVTQVASSGGLLQEAMVTLLIGLRRARLATLLEHVRECCHVRRRYIPTQLDGTPFPPQSTMIEAEVGGATVYALDVERFEQL